VSSLVEISKAVTAEKKRKEQQFGLANNAFGATAGALATRSVYREKRALHLHDREKRYQAKVVGRQQKASDKAAARFRAGKPIYGPIKTAREAISARTPKAVKRYAAPAAVAGAVGMQLVNAGADAQSAQYFARELATGPKKSRSASGGQQGKVGKSLEVSKKFRSYDPESDRRHRLGIYEGLGAVGAAGGAGYAGKDVYERVKAVPKGTRKAKVSAIWARNRKVAGGAGAAVLAGTGAVAARRSYLRDRNQPWT
jgi:hypothetical protein